MAAPQGVIRLALFGQPVAHSLSPGIHRRFAAQAGLAIEYRALETTPGEFASSVRALAAAGGRGCNITVPFKRLAWRLAQRSSPGALRAEAANTLVFEQPNDWYADNTDGRGLLRDLRRCPGVALAGARVLLLGAGGAAAGILGDLLEAGTAEIVLANRTPGPAGMLAERHRALGAVSACTPGQVAALSPFDIVINATSAGHLGERPQITGALFAVGGLCYDLNYAAAAEPLRQWCAAQAIAYRDGLGMLVDQAALAFELFSGRTPDSDAVLEELRRSLRPAPASG